MEKQTHLSGLTQAQVNQAYKAGQINQFKEDAGNGTWQIIRRNVFTLFNFLNFMIALALIAVQAWSNLVFFAVICLNAVSGIIIEFRAKRMIDQLNLLSLEKVTVIRDGKAIAIKPEELVLGDLVKLSAGEQVPSDGRVVQGFAEANEAMLTGESDLVKKAVNDEVLSGSYLASGQVYIEIIRVGADNYAAQLMLEAKTYKPINSQILTSLGTIANFTGKIIIPFGIILFLEALMAKMMPLKDSVIYTAAPLLGMLPKGIALLTITSLLTAVIKLGRRKVLVQEMYSVETLARVDTLCLDKTGTITEGKMLVQDLIGLTSDFSDEDLKAILSAYMAASDDKNPTALAIRTAYSHISHDYQASHIIPFSSDRKWGAMHFDDFGTVLLGAPEMLVADIPSVAHEAQTRGSRVLALGLSPQKIPTETPSVPMGTKLLALIEIADPIRQGAKETLDYLRTQQVDLKIISGDNPVTVSNIAKKAGFINYQAYLDCSTVDDDALQKAALETAIFGRVSPHQKKLLVQTLKAAGRTVAMTGDGVNDILALREADCSIVMAEGDPATRQIANLVLLNSEFNDVPEILFEGRRVINNITRVAPIFFIKTIYSFILAILCMLSLGLGPENLMIFPFIPIQITLIDQFVEGFPPFVLSFERNEKPVEKDFLKRTMLKALPSALIIVVSVVFLRIFGSQNGWSSQDQNTVAFYLLGLTGFFSVFRASFPLNIWRSLLVLWSLGGFLASAYFLRHLLEINTLTTQTFPVFTILFVIALLVFILADRWQKKKWKDIA